LINFILTDFGQNFCQKSKIVSELRQNIGQKWLIYTDFRRNFDQIVSKNGIKIDNSAQNLI